MEEEITLAIRNLKPLVSCRAAEAEDNYQISGAVIDAMKSAGIFRMFVPREYGGLELELPQIIEVIRTLSRIDASVGWIAMIGAGSALFATMLPRRIFERIYRDHVNAIIAGSTQILGRVEKRDDSCHASGRWPFASGCQHADWMLGFCKLIESSEDESGKPKSSSRSCPRRVGPSSRPGVLRASKAPAATISRSTAPWRRTRTSSIWQLRIAGPTARCMKACHR